MDLEGAVVWLCLTDAEARRVVGAIGPNNLGFDDPKKTHAISFTIEHERQYGAIPSQQQIVDICKVSLQDQGLTTEWCLDELDKRKRFRAVVKLQTRIAESLERNNVVQCEELLQQYRPGRLRRSGAHSSLFDHGDEVLASYHAIKDGRTGLPYPWPSLNKLTMGMWPKTATMVVGRSGIGKTGVSIVCARHIWMTGHRVLFVSPEVSRVELAERFFAIEARVAATKLIRGELTDYDLDRLASSINTLRVEEGFYVLDFEQAELNASNIELAIDECQPDLLVLDSMYALKIGGGGKGDRINQIIEWIVDVTKRKSVATLMTSQQNRSAEDPELKKAGGGARMSSVALSDQIMWDIQQAFAIEQDQDMRQDRRMRVYDLKIRRGERLPRGFIDVNWNFDTMDFSEISEQIQYGRF